MTTELIVAIVGIGTGVLGSFGFYMIVIVSRFVRLETDVAFVMGFFRKLQEKSIDMLIRTDTPELDDLVNRYRDGAATEEEIRQLLYLTKREHIQAIRHEKQLEESPVKKIGTAIFLAGLEAEYEYLIKRREAKTQMQRVKLFFGRIF